MPAVCFAELVSTGLGSVWEEQYDLYTQFQLNSSSLELTVLIYTVNHSLRMRKETAPILQREHRTN